MTKYITMNPVRHDGKLYGTGEEIEVEAEACEALIDCDAIYPAEPTPAPKAPATKPATTAGKKKPARNKAVKQT